MANSNSVFTGSRYYVSYRFPACQSKQLTRTADASRHLSNQHTVTAMWHRQKAMLFECWLLKVYWVVLCVLLASVRCTAGKSVPPELRNAGQGRLPTTFLPPPLSLFRAPSPRPSL